VPPTNPRRRGALQTDTIAAQKKFFALAERFRGEADPAQAEQLGVQLGRLVFGGESSGPAPSAAPRKERRR